MDSHTKLSRLREKTAGYVGKIFTEEMRQSIRMDAAELMNMGIDEGQAMMCRYACSNANTERCPQNGGDGEEWETEIARQCNRDGGFEI